MASNSSPSRGTSIIMPDWAGRLPDDWSWHQLDEICLEIVDCPHSTPEIVEDGPNLMARTTDVLGGVFRADEARRVSESTYRERTRRAEPTFGDLLYSREGTYFGIAAEVPPHTKVCLGQRMVLLRPNPAQIQTAYLRHWLNSPAIQSYIHGHRDGSVAERLNLPTIRRLPICAPAFPEQRAIAHILGTLDDKIELNRRMSETLEAMARALFKSWFVDFDPVRAKAERRDPGLPQPLADLFPARLVDSELGEIPEGWEVKAIGDVVKVVGGSTPSTKVLEYWNGEYCWATPKDLSGLTAPVLLDTERRITEEGLSKISSRLLAVGTLLLSSRAPVGYLAIAKVPVAINQGYIGMPPSDRLSSVYVLYWCEVNMARIKERAGGTTFQEISKKNFRPIPIIVPAKEVVTRFDDMVGPMFELLVSNERESRTLAALRDTLLPKLISGELRVKDAERFIGRVT